MEITIPYIERKFEEFNRQMFANRLPMPTIRLSNAKTFLGQCTYKTRRSWYGKVERYDFTLRINTRIDLSEEEVEDTIIHEMIHYYIGYNQLKDTSAHGQLFRQMMNSINERFGRHLAISHRGSKQQMAQAADQRARYHVIAVVDFHDGRRGIKVLPRVLPSILKYYNAVSAVREVASVRLHMSNDVFFNRFPNSSSLKVHFIAPADIDAHLADADSLECDGKSVRHC